jgi:hypothetical protein
MRTFLVGVLIFLQIPVRFQLSLRRLHWRLFYWAPSCLHCFQDKLLLRVAIEIPYPSTQKLAVKQPYLTTLISSLSFKTAVITPLFINHNFKLDHSTKHCLFKIDLSNLFQMYSLVQHLCWGSGVSFLVVSHSRLSRRKI